MVQRLRSAAVFLAAATASVVFAAPVQAAPPTPVTVVASGLDDPTGLSNWAGRFYAAESSAGEISGFVPGAKPYVRLNKIPGVSGVDRKFDTFYFVTGESGEPGASTLYSTVSGKPRHKIADLAAYELANNPDGQQQFGEDGAPLDALSNPFAVLTGRGFDNRVFVADGGANAVLVADANGKVSTFFAPPVVTTGACAGRPNNDAQHTGCDPVPTGLAWGPDGNLYVSTLSGEAPGQGRVYVLDPFGGKVLGVIGGFSSPTGVAVGDGGSVYVSELLEGAPEGEGPPPAGFDPSTIGRIVRVDRNGVRSVAQVTMPVSLKVVDGQLYSTAWSVAGLFGFGAKLGQVVRVDGSAFVRS
jgi:hypothetical protein